MTMTIVRIVATITNVQYIGAEVDKIMRVLNYSLEYLLETATPEPPRQPYSSCQFRILCRIIRSKHISREEFYNLLNRTYHVSGIKYLDYEKMYRLIYILNHWKFIYRKDTDA